MKRLSIVSAFVCILLWFSPAGAAENELGNFQKVSKELIDLVTDTKIDQALILKKADELMAMGVDIAKDVSAHEAECKQVLEVFIQDSQKMKQLSMEEMEALYHDGGIFEKKGINIDPDDDKYEECFETSHFIVHPATVPILISAYNKDHDKMHLNTIKEELVTLYNHVKEHSGH